MLLDTASLYFRAFFGVPDTVTKDALERAGEIVDTGPCSG